MHARRGREIKGDFSVRASFYRFVGSCDALATISHHRILAPEERTTWEENGFSFNANIPLHVCFSDGRNALAVSLPQKWEKLPMQRH